MNAIDSCYLHLRGYSKLVIEIREPLLDKLTDEYLIMVNYGNLGSIYCRTGRVKEALSLYENALKSARKEKNKVGEGIWLGNLGNAYADLGDLSQAITYYTQALTIAREIGNKQNEGIELSHLGVSYGDLGDLPQAIAYYTQALTIAREIGDKQGEGDELSHLGEAYLECYVQESAETYLTQAIECHQQALEISEEINYPITICNNLRRLGLEYLIASDMMQTETHFRRCVEACDSALARAQLSEVLYFQAFALLALECVGKAMTPPCPPSTGSGQALQGGNKHPPSPPQGGNSAPLAPPRRGIEEAYQKAIEVNAAAGVLKERIHEVERLQRILEQRGFPVPAAVANILALLQQAGAAE